MRSKRILRIEKKLLFIIGLVFAVAHGAFASDCRIHPTVPVSGEQVTVVYNPTDGSLAGADAVFIHRGVNGWAQAVDVPMVGTNGLWTLTYRCPDTADSLNYVFHDGKGGWDKNEGMDWNFAVSVRDADSFVSPSASVSGAHVMMQGFYWDCPENWYGTMAAKAAELRYMEGGWGIDRIWFPAPQKSDSGRHSMGYDPYDYYDLGQYYQKGTTATHFGTQADLRNATALYRSLGIACMADIVLNHRCGGAEEANPNLDGESSWTDFGRVASGQCTWGFNQFHPSSREESDAGPFEDFPDVCHAGPAGTDLIRWGRWLTDPANAGFDGGWRLDYVKGVNPSYIRKFIKGTGNAFTVLECWGDIPMIEKYLKKSRAPAAFDFPAFNTMVDVFNHSGSIAQLVDPKKVYAAKDPARAVTFVANHDTDKDAHVESIVDNTLLAYAFILTYQGYPCIFWKDYYTYGLAEAGGQPGNGIKPLVWVRGALGGGQPDIQLLKTDDENLLVYGTLKGSRLAPGYIVAINNHPTQVRRAKVLTRNRFLWNKTLKGHAWYSYLPEHNLQPTEIHCNDMGNAILEVPPRGYVVYSVVADLPENWVAEDVGKVGVVGSAASVEGVFILSGSGDGLDGADDVFQFASTQAKGDVSITARMGRLDRSPSGAQSGVMIRENNDGLAPSAAVLFMAENGISFQWRSEKNGPVQSVAINGLQTPCWVGLTRSGQTVHARYSLDGKKWHPIGGEQVIQMTEHTSVGLVVSCAERDNLATAVFDRVVISGGD